MQGSASENRREDEFESFIVAKDQELVDRFKRFCHAKLDRGGHTRRVYNVEEWETFVRALRNRDAWAVGWKWFPYTHRGTLSGPDRQLEVEIWFEHPGSKVGRFLLVHVHSETKWDKRGADPFRVTAVNIRHTQSTSQYWYHNQEAYWYYGVYPEEGHGHFEVAKFHPPWDRVQSATTHVEGTSTADVEFVLKAGLGSEFFWESNEFRSTGEPSI